MSEIVGSCSSGSSGPSPKTSSRTSSEICCFSSELRRVGSASISEITAWRTSARTLWLSMVARASRLILSTSLRCRVNFSSWYSGFKLAFWRVEFFSSLCSQETCWLVLLLFSRDENIRAQIPASGRGFESAAFKRFLVIGDAAAQPQGHVFDGLSQIPFGSQRLAQRDHPVQGKI